MANATKLGTTKIGKIKINEIARGLRSNITLVSIKVSDRRVILGDVVTYIDNNLEGNIVEIVPLILLTQKVENTFMITFIGYLDNALIPYPNYVPQSFGLYDSEGDMIFCSNLSLTNFASKFIVGRIDLVNVSSDITSKITGNGLYNDYLNINRIYQLLTTPRDGTDENSLYSIRSLNGGINKVGVKLGNENIYIGYDDISDCFISL
ncbi:MAG: hypothetical protein QW806_10175 [Nitrososphaerota archaeon]